jgi:hypothetical protein
MSSTARKRWAIAGAIALLLVAGLTLRRTHAVDVAFEIDASYLDVVAGFADIERYPELTGGRAERGVIHSSEERTDASGNRVVEVAYSVWALGNENTGERVYTYFAEQPVATIDLRFHTAWANEDTHIFWTFADADGATRIVGKGSRTAPWLVSLFSAYHTEQALGLFQRIERQLTAR